MLNLSQLQFHLQVILQPAEAVDPHPYQPPESASGSAFDAPASQLTVFELETAAEVVVEEAEVSWPQPPWLSCCWAWLSGLGSEEQRLHWVARKSGQDSKAEHIAALLAVVFPTDSWELAQWEGKM